MRKIERLYELLLWFQDHGLDMDRFDQDALEVVIAAVDRNQNQDWRDYDPTEERED